MKFNKKVLSIFIIALFAVILVACTDKTTQLPTTEPTTTVPTTSAPTTLPPTTLPYDFTTVVAALKAHYSDTLDNDEFVATSNLDLITSLQDLTISWSSNNLDYLSNAGEITKPAFSVGDQTVILTATITHGSETKEVMFFVTIGASEKSAAEKAEEVFLVVAAFPIKDYWTAADNYHAVDNKTGLQFLTTGKDSDNNVYTIVWTSSNSEYLDPIKGITQPLDADVTVTMTATITISGVPYSVQKVFKIAKVVDPSVVDTFAEGKALFVTNNPKLDYKYLEYIKVPGVTVVGVSETGIYVTDGAQIIYVRGNVTNYKIGDVVDVTGPIQLYYNAWQIKGSPLLPLVVKPSTAAVKVAPSTIKENIQGVILDSTLPSQENLFSHKQYTVTAKVYYNSAWGDYSVFLVPINYDFSAPLQVGATQPNGDSLMMYYPSNDEVLRAFHGKSVTLNIVVEGYRTDKWVWYASFFGGISNVELHFETDEEAVNAALDTITFPFSIIEDQEFDLTTSIYGVTLSYASTNTAIFNATTGLVTVENLTEQASVEVTVTAVKGLITKTKKITINAGPLPLSTIDDVYDKPAGYLVKVKGILTADEKPARFFMKDITGGLALDTYSFQNEFKNIAKGSEIIITGTVSIVNGLYEIDVLGYEVLTTTPALPTPVSLDDVEFTNNNLKAFMSEMVSFSGFVAKTDPVADSYGTYQVVLMNIVTDEEILVRLDNRTLGYVGAQAELVTIKAGDEVIITGAILGWYNGYQLLITNANQFEKGTNGLTSAQKLALDVAALVKTMKVSQTTDLPVGIYGTTYTALSIVGFGENYINIDTLGKLTITQPYGVNVSAEIELVAVNGTEEVNTTITVVVANIPVTSTTTDLIFSEYGEGSSNNKWLEIFNGTGEDVDLSQYSIAYYNNGSTTVTSTTPLNGVLKAGEVYLMTTDEAVATLKNAADKIYSHPSPIHFNGNDQVALLKGTTMIDAIGTFGNTADFAKDITLIRKPTIKTGNAVYNVAEWNQEVIDFYTNINVHSLEAFTKTDAMKIGNDKALLNLNETLYYSKSVTLPVLGVNGSTIAWTIKDADGASVTLTGADLVLPWLTSGTTATVVLEATLVYGSGETQLTDKVLVTYILIGESAVDKVSLDKAALNIDETVFEYDEVTLPVLGSKGSTISWVVDGKATLEGQKLTYIFNDGVAYQVTLTATITFGTATNTRIFTINVSPATLVTEFSVFNQKTGSAWTFAGTDMMYIQGVISAINGTKGFFLQDESGDGIYAIGTLGVDYKVGDMVIIHTKLKVDNSVRSLDSWTIKDLISSGNTLEVTTMTYEALAAMQPNFYEYASRLVNVSGIIIKEFRGNYLDLIWTSVGETPTVYMLSFYFNDVTTYAWLKDVYKVGDALPEFTFILHNIYSTTTFNILPQSGLVMSDQQAVNVNKALLPASLKLTENYTIPKSKYSATITITAISTELTGYITTAGVVTLPGTDAVGTITFTVTKGSVTDTVTIPVTVKAMSNANKLLAIKSELESDFEGVNYTPETTITLPTTDSRFGSTIAWVSSDPIINVSTGAIGSTSTLLNVVLTATVTLGSEPVMDITLNVTVSTVVYTTLMIYELYTAGGNAGATYNKDYVVIYNGTNAAIDLSGYTLQYASKTGAFSIKATLTGTINSGDFFIVSDQNAGKNGAALPMAIDFLVADGLGFGGSDGKVVLANNNIVVTSPTATNVVDYIGYGSATAYEGTAAVAALSTTTSAKRNSFTDTNNNNTDFTVAAINLGYLS